MEEAITEASCNPRSSRSTLEPSFPASLARCRLTYGAICLIFGEFVVPSTQSFLRLLYALVHCSARNPIAALQCLSSVGTGTDQHFDAVSELGSSRLNVADHYEVEAYDIGNGAVPVRLERGNAKVIEGGLLAGLEDQLGVSVSVGEYRDL